MQGPFQDVVVAMNKMHGSEEGKFMRKGQVGFLHALFLYYFPFYMIQYIIADPLHQVGDWKNHLTPDQVTV